jgi:hypothetical protein
MHGVGFCGAHRTGKTTLAEQLAKAKFYPFIRTSTTKVAADNGIDVSKPMDWKTRMAFQWKVLEAFNAHFATAYETREPWVTDRTPLDLLMYTMADAKGDVEVDMEDLDRYVTACYDTMNAYFGVVIHVPPGIPLVVEPGKAALNKAYIELLNMVVFSSMYSHRMADHIIKIHLDSDMLDLQKRIAFCYNELDKHKKWAAAA